MNLIYILPFTLMVLCFGACSNSQADSTETAESSRFSSAATEHSFNEVMAIHDEVMPFIGEMKRSKKELQAHKVQLEQTPEPSNEEIAKVEEAIQLLTAGDSSMFDWMKKFKSPTPATPETEALPYLTQEKQKVEVVSQTMKEAMNKSKAILKTIEQ